MTNAVKKHQFIKIYSSEQLKKKQKTYTLVIIRLIVCTLIRIHRLIYYEPWLKRSFFFLYKISLMNFRDRHLKEKIKYQILSLYYKL
jgi:hypothetical protein